MVGVLGPVTLDPELDNAVFVTEWSAQHVLGTNGEPNQLYIRATPGSTQATANAVHTAISLGGSSQVSTQIPSDVLQAASQANGHCSRWRSWPACSHSSSAGSASPT